MDSIYAFFTEYMIFNRNFYKGDSAEMYKLLILEDDLQMNHALKIYFEKEGYDVYQAFNAIEAGQILQKMEVDIMLADIGLPGKSGLDFVKMILRDKKIPTLFLTARDEEQDIINGYEAGCEEYIVKPISPVILLKKIEVILRRNKIEGNLFVYKDLKIDYEKRRVWKNKEEINLTDREWNILKLLSKNKGKVVTKEVMLENVWDVEGNFVDEQVIKVVINRLRKKLGQGTTSSEYIRNVFGVGYTFGE